MRIENDLYLVELEPGHGALVRLRDKVGGYELIAEPRLADSFRLLLPIAGTQDPPSQPGTGVRCNHIFGKEQRAPSIEKTTSGLRCHWAGPLRNERGEFDLDVTIWIDLVCEDVRFRCEVRNGTPHELAEVWFVALGGMLGLGEGDGARDTELALPRDNKGWRQPIFRDFGNTRGQTLGIHSSEHSFGYPGFMCMPWASFFHERLNRAVYTAALEDTPRVKAIRFLLEPGAAEHRAGGNWPTREEVGDLPMGLVVNWVHFPYTRPGQTFKSADVVVRAHAGGWRESAAIYRNWFDAHYPVVRPGSTWIRRETAFLHTMFMLPEDNINLRFTDIGRWARDAKQHGVGHVMIAGWQVGGHDRGYPYYEPDPRLGTWDELKAGIRAAHDAGVRVSFFVNCQPIDMTTEWYRRELHRYRVLDPYGVQYFVTNYWGMGTLSARTRFLNATPHTEMNPAHPQVRALLIPQFKKLVEIGADGLHFDKFFQTPFDFNPLLTHTTPDRAHHEGVLKFAEELTAACRAINPEFCISYEGGWDRLFQYAETLWWGQGEDTALKAVFPQMAFTTGVEQPWDYNKVNRAVLQGENLLIGPANYNRGTDYPPMQKLLAYIAELTRIRRELFDYVCLGDRRDASHGMFRCSKPILELEGPAAQSPHLRWAVFRNPKDGRRAVVLANLGREPLTISKLAMADNGSGACRVYETFQPRRDSRFPLSLHTTAERVSFVVEV